MSRVRVAAADVDDLALEPISVPNFDALPWTVRWMCAAEVEASGMVEALACAAHADGLFGALRVRPSSINSVARGRTGGSRAPRKSLRSDVASIVETAYQVRPSTQLLLPSRLMSGSPHPAGR